MHNIFIINKAAGKLKGKDNFIKKVEELVAASPAEVSYYLTEFPGDGKRYVSEQCKASKEPLRIFSCGGDGTLNEVINGAVGHDNVVVGCVPIGTGNDFIRYFGTAEQFCDLEAQLNGNATPVDLIKYEGTFRGNAYSGYAINMFNIGFDCNVVDKVAELKRYPLIAGSMAYLLGVVIILAEKKGANLKIEAEDGTNVIHNGPLLLTTIANGCFCGGGVKSNPVAMLDDGLFDLQIVKDISRTKFLRLFSSYAKGTHLDTKNISDILTYTTLSSLKITALDGSMRIAVDGERTDLEQVSFSVHKKILNFSVPAFK